MERAGNKRAGEKLSESGSKKANIDNGAGADGEAQPTTSELLGIMNTNFDKIMDKLDENNQANEKVEKVEDELKKSRADWEKQKKQLKRERDEARALNRVVVAMPLTLEASLEECAIEDELRSTQEPDDS